ncbi:MAG: arsenate reductase ArsC [Candidatus Thermoplasmatota archaeon]|nr:arsenate reductase ArsC [Candidatus Thermoplasmatota archaeon]
MKDKNYLFVCVENAGRSKMAEAFAKKIGMNAQSAGTLPSVSVNPVVMEAMREKGIDMSDSKPTMLHDSMINWADLVIVMGCSLQEACPAPLLAALQKKIVDWNLPDPKGKPIEEVRRIRDMIEKNVLELARKNPE